MSGRDLSKAGFTWIFFTSKVSKKQAARYLAFQMSYTSFGVPSFRKILAIGSA